LSIQRKFFCGSKDVLLSFEAKIAPVLKLTQVPVCQEQGEAGKLLIDAVEKIKKCRLK
jgi:hypothetical protein